jgi:hypothetical protein
MDVLTPLTPAAAALVLASCYSPDLRDCTVTCTSSADCAGAQVCGADHFCADAARAGTCSITDADSAPDARDVPGMSDARGLSDAPIEDASLDAPPDAALHLVVIGRGDLIAGNDTCDMDCRFALPIAPIDVVAVAGPDQVLDGWFLGPCIGSTSSTCTVTPPATVGVKFHKHDH